MGHVISLDEDSHSLESLESLVGGFGDSVGVGFDPLDSLFELLEGALGDSSGSFGQSDDEAVGELLVLGVLVIGLHDNGLFASVTTVHNDNDSSGFITNF